MDFEKSSIERLKRTLYSRNENVVPKEKRTPVSGREVNTPVNWGTVPDFDKLTPEMTKKDNSFFNKFLLGSVVFFVVALAIASFIFFGGLNMISSDNLDVKIVAPSSISSGEELLLVLSVINGNRTDLEDVTLYIGYPTGAQAVGGGNKTLGEQSVKLGTIVSGGSTDYSIRSILSGEKDAINSFDFRLEYKIKGSNAVFSKEKTYDVIINSSPILLNTSYPKEVNSGESMTLNIKIVSNSGIVIKDSMIKVEYPYGFTYGSSNIKPLNTSSASTTSSLIWNMGDLKNGDKKTLSITGILVGQNLEDRSFRVSAGVEKSSAIKDFDTALATNVLTIGIRKSFFDLSVSSGQDSNLQMGQSIPVTINWSNTLPDKIINAQIKVTISGNALDKSSVAVDGNGFYSSSNNTIFWDKNSINNLSSLSPGDVGSVRFSVSSFKDVLQMRSIINPHIDINVAIKGDRSGSESGPVSSNQDITIKIPSTINFTSKVFRDIGPFSNTGPIPPKVDKESTYTVTWTLTNTSNDLKDVVASAVLPAGIVWKEEISPASERVSYNPDTRTISWNISKVDAGSGFAYSPGMVSFKVGITPSANQVDLTPILLEFAGLTATDTYSQTTLSAQVSAVTTQYSDPTFKFTDSVVVK
ncbi:MAG TPA: hypothetical protein VJG67_03430 [Candidatus Paceibacterota bacterium]